MLVFHFFMKGSSTVALDAHLCLKPTSSQNTPRVKEEMLRTYLEVVNSLLHIYATDNVIAETGAALTRYIQASTMLLPRYAEALIAMSLKCGEVYDEYFLRGVFIEGSHGSVRQSMPYWSTHPWSTLYDLARHATSIRVLQMGKDVHSGKATDHCQDTKHRRGEQRNVPYRINVIKREVVPQYLRHRRRQTLQRLCKSNSVRNRSCHQLRRVRTELVRHMSI